MPRGDKPTTPALALKDGWIYEGSLPPSITKDQYDWWFKESLVLDGVRMGPPLATKPQSSTEPPERIRVCIRAGKEDWIGVAYAAESGDPSKIHEYVSADLLVAKVKEEREAAFKEAIEIVKRFDEVHCIVVSLEAALTEK